MSEKIISTKYSDQTLGTYVDFLNAGTDSISQIQAITGLKRDDIRKIDMATVEKIVASYSNGLRQDEKVFKQFIDIDGVKFGFHPNLKSMTFGEWLDLSEFSKNFPNQLPELMCILYRPVTAEINLQYKIEEYDSDVHLKYVPQMRKLNLANVNAALLFFFDTQKRFSEQYTRIFREGAGDAEEGDNSVSRRGETLASVYQWWHVIEEMAERDVTKFDAITNQRATTIFTHLTYAMDYANSMQQKLT